MKEHTEGHINTNMPKNKKSILPRNCSPEDYMSCFGFFRSGDRVCYKLCALNIRCLIKKEKLMTAEFIEDFLEAEEYTSVSQQ